jgi:hypothetical protein
MPENNSGSRRAPSLTSIVVVAAAALGGASLGGFIGARGAASCYNLRPCVLLDVGGGAPPACVYTQDYGRHKAGDRCPR